METQYHYFSVTKALTSNVSDSHHVFTRSDEFNGTSLDFGSAGRIAIRFGNRIELKFFWNCKK